MQRRLKNRRIVRSFKAKHVTVEIDPVLIEQALINLLENAVAFSPPGSSIRVSVALEGDDVLLTVEDEGPGIRRQDQAHVFDKFFRSEGDRTGRPGGVGLGLSVARGVVDAFDGRITLESPIQNGGGARFTIRLPSHRALEIVE